MARYREHKDGTWTRLNPETNTWEPSEAPKNIKQTVPMVSGISPRVKTGIVEEMLAGPSPLTPPVSPFTGEQVKEGIPPAVVKAVPWLPMAASAGAAAMAAPTKLFKATASVGKLADEIAAYDAAKYQQEHPANKKTQLAATILPAMIGGWKVAGKPVWGAFGKGYEQMFKRYPALMKQLAGSRVMGTLAGGVPRAYATGAAMRGEWGSPLLEPRQHPVAAGLETLGSYVGRPGLPKMAPTIASALGGPTPKIPSEPPSATFTRRVLGQYAAEEGVPLAPEEAKVVSGIEAAAEKALSEGSPFYAAGAETGPLFGGIPAKSTIPVPVRQPALFPEPMMSPIRYGPGFGPVEPPTAVPSVGKDISSNVPRERWGTDAAKAMRYMRDIERLKRMMGL